MSFRAGLFDSTEIVQSVNGYPQGNKAETADFFAHYFAGLVGDGVPQTPTDNLQVVATSGMVVRIKPGSIYIKGYHGWLAEPEDITIESSAQVRTVYVGVRLNLTTGEIVPYYGTTIVRTDAVYEMPLAKINIQGSAVSITDNMITDLRGTTEYCGYVEKLTDETAEQLAQEIATKADQTFAEDIAGRITNPNLLINGGFDVWQELESYTLTGASVVGYCADQWHTWSSGTNTGSNALITRSDAGLRMQHNGFAGYTFIAQTVDETILPKLIGKTVTLSFEATVSQGGRINGVLWDAKKFGKYGAADTGTSLASIPVTGDGTRHMYSVTGVVPADITDLDVVFSSPNNQATQDYTLHWVKLELGGAATPYVPEDYTLELLQCMRYYRRPKETVTTLPRITDHQYLLLDHWFNVPMRGDPTVTLYEPRNIYGPGNPEGYKFGDEGWGTANHVWVKGNTDRTGFKRVNGIGANGEKLDSFLLADSSGVAGNSYYCHYEADARRYS